MDHFINTINDRNEETLRTQFLTIPDSPNHIDRNQESWCLEDFNQDSISSHQIELDQFQIIDKLASFHFKKIEHESECDPDPQLCDLVLIFKFMLTLVSLTGLNPIPEPTLILKPINLEHESPILDITFYW